MTRYSLWEQPWIPVTDGLGERRPVSIREAVARAHELREVSDPSPLIAVSIHRLLMAVLYRLYRPKNAGDWAALWRRGRFDDGVLDGYGAVWSDRFDLFHPTHPFYQVPSIAEEKVHPISALILEAASGNNPTLFDHGLAEGAEALPYDRAAGHLIAHQLFAVGGGVSKPFNRMDGPLTKGLVVEARGASLFETLLLNLIPLDQWAPLVRDRGKDLPFWEIDDPPEPVKEGTQPLGPMHYLTWQSRQVHLVADHATGRVGGCQIRQRYCLPKDGERIDPGKAYRQSEKEGWLPFKVDKQRAAWQFTHVLLDISRKDLERPHLAAWLSVVKQMRGLSVPREVSLCLTGLTNHPKKAAKIELWRRERLPLPLAFLEKPDLVGDLKELLLKARMGEALLQRTAQALVWALGERQHFDLAVGYVWTGKVADGKKIPEGFAGLGQSLGLVTWYWPALEGPFRQAMADLGQEPNDEGFVALQQRWETNVKRAAGQAFRSVRDNLVHAEAPFEVLTRIEHAFQSRLSGIFTEKQAKEAPQDDEEPDE